MLRFARLKWGKSTIGRSAKVLSRSDQKKIILVTLLQIFFGLLDLIGVAIIGILGALAISGIESKQPGNRVNTALKLLQIDQKPFQTQAAMLGIAAAIILIGRTILSILFTRKTLFFLARRGAVISSRLIRKLLAQPLIRIQERTSQETMYAVTSGVSAITLGVLGAAVGLISDGSLLLVMAIGLLIVDPAIAISTFLVFFAIAIALYRLMHTRAQSLGQKSSNLSIKSNEKIIEVLHSYRESVVRNRRFYYSRIIGDIRLELADADAEQSFMPYISKYVIETTVVIGALVISAIQFILQDATHAVATLSVFLAAGTRIAPAVLRVQQGAISIKGNLGVAQPTLNLIEEFGGVEDLSFVSDEPEIEHFGFNGDIEIQNVRFTYPGSAAYAVSDVSISVPKGQSVAFVGPSGAGKTTLIDLILGVLEPDSGQILISGKAPLETITIFPGAISYVPQDVVISNGTIRENVSLGYPAIYATDDLVNNALGVAQLKDFVLTLPKGIDTEVGERGTRISGGQRQRLGIARAMFTKPALLVLDEATSSLDGETESKIADAIQCLRGETTVVMIAHRLSTVRNVDCVVYLEEGRVVASGKFDEVRNMVPDFDHQAKLMGL